MVENMVIVSFVKKKPIFTVNRLMQVFVEQIVKQNILKSQASSMRII